MNRREEVGYVYGVGVDRASVHPRVGDDRPSTYTAVAMNGGAKIGEQDSGIKPVEQEPPQPSNLNDVPTLSRFRWIYQRILTNTIVEIGQTRSESARWDAEDIR